MASCETQLWDLVREIEPSQSQKDGAQRSHNYLRDVLDTGKMASRILDSYLSGSYSRDTAINPIDDVDIIFVIDPSIWKSSLLSALLGSSLPPPQAVLDSFANAIRYRYPVSSVYGQRRSVRLELNHLDIDVVPAVETENKMVIRIPDSESDSWIHTAPKKHAAFATAVNKLRNGKFKPLVKLLKFWNSNLPSTARVKSFAIETMAVRIFMKTPFETLEEGLLKFYSLVVKISENSMYPVSILPWVENFGISLSWLECSVPDLAGTGSNTTAGVDEERRKRFIENTTRSRDKMVEAQKANSILTACKLVNQALRV